MNNREWFKTAEYGMMVHWGLYSLPGGEWHNEIKAHNYTEWMQHTFRIPNSEYEQLAKIFNPIYFNADEWIRLAKDCGMQYFVITAKHHDGFAMYHSNADKYNIVDATPFKRDIIAELAESCAKHGIKLGLYYSQDTDWHCFHGGGFLNDHGSDNTWDFPDRSKKDYSIYFEEKVKPQVTELLTGYGDLCLIWFDEPWTLSKEQSDELVSLVRHYQPECLVSSRLYRADGRETADYDYLALDDNQYPESEEEFMHLNSPYGLYETSGTMNKSYGYSRYDHNWITADEVNNRRRRLNKFGINYLLNVGPDGLGRIPVMSQKILREAAEKYNK